MVGRLRSTSVVAGRRCASVSEVNNYCYCAGGLVHSICTRQWRLRTGMIVVFEIRERKINFNEPTCIYIIHKLLLLLLLLYDVYIRVMNTRVYLWRWRVGDRGIRHTHRVSRVRGECSTGEGRVVGTNATHLAYL